MQRLIKYNKNDEWYTPVYGVEPILEFLPPGASILCPFDTEESHFVKILRSRGHRVVSRHLENQEDFFDLSPKDVEGFDCIVSNPPYSLKNEILERLFELGKPFAMLLNSLEIFGTQKRYHLFKENDFELLVLDKRIGYLASYTEKAPCTSAPFSSWYVCHRVLPEKIMFREIDKQRIYFE